MKTIKTKVYEAKDGSLHSTSEECLKYEASLPNYEYFKLSHSVDLTETGYFMSFTYIRVNTNGFDISFTFRLLSDWCYRKLGNSVDYVQGCAMCHAWRLDFSNEKEFKESKGISWGGRLNFGKQVTLQYEKGKGLI